MGLRLVFAASLLLGGWALVSADFNDWQLTAVPPPVPDADKSRVGRAVCGDGRFDTTEAGVRCRVCPDFTSNAGSSEGLYIGHMLRGRFTTAKAEGEWLLDTEGCEGHFRSFGGAILLAPKIPKPVPATPATALGHRLVAKPAGGPLKVVFYKPGFRLNDCLVFGGEKTRSQLVCNEADSVHGEVVGHVSALEISRRGVMRWRLLRWYDNSWTDMPEMVSVVPTEMRRVELSDGQWELQVKIRIVETIRESYENGSDPAGKTIDLEFSRKGQRFFATERTQEHLRKISRLTRQMLE